MDKKCLSGYKRDRKELAAIEKALSRLEDQAERIPVVMGKVSMSGGSFPYIEGHMSVQMYEPKESDRISKRIREKESRRDILLKRVASVEKFINDMPKGIDKEIFEMWFLDGMSQKEIGEIVGLEQSSVSKRVDKYLS